MWETLQGKRISAREAKGQIQGLKPLDDLARQRRRPAPRGSSTAAEGGSPRGWVDWSMFHLLGGKDTWEVSLLQKLHTQMFIYGI